MNELSIMVFLMVIIIVLTIITILIFKQLGTVAVSQNDKIMEIIKNLTAPRPLSQMLPPLYLSYEICLKTFNRFIIITFQRVFITHVLPNISNADGKISLLSPNDTKYNEFILEITLQVYEGIPSYLKKSLYFYFGIEDDKNTNDSGLDCLTKHIANYSIGLLNQQIVKNAEYIETHGPSAYPYIQAIKKYPTSFNEKPIEHSPETDGLII
jgi:hypothetical protein